MQLLSEDEYNYSTLVNDRSGHSFTQYIVDQTDIGALPLYKDPESAVEYCYNKNKRNINGEVDKLVWYLPAIDEIEEIVKSQYNGNYSYIRFEDFRGKFYWSSQPAYEYNYIDVSRSWGSRYGIYMTDNIERARATKVTFTGGDPNDDNNYTVEASGLKNEFGDGDDTVNNSDIVTSATFMAHNKIYVEASGMITAKVDEVHPPEAITKEDSFNRRNNDGSWTHRVRLPEYQDGAKMRTDLARVRCVRKQ